jgi:hypothetical protein
MKQRIYIDTSVVGGYFDDEFKDATKALFQRLENKVDVLASWNFKHIVNLDKIKGYNSVNLRKGYAMIEIRSPKDLINYGND